MKASKENVCVYIKNNAHLKKAEDLIIKYNQKHLIDESTFFLDTDGVTEYNYLYFGKATKDWGLGRDNDKTIITLSELEEILKHES